VVGVARQAVVRLTGRRRVGSSGHAS
jgi:hypothetical protein